MNKCRQCWTTIFVVALCASSAWSQDDSQNSVPSPAALTPDTRPLSGAESITLGSLLGERSYLQPGFLVAQSVDTNAQFQFSGQSGLVSTTALAGRLTLQQVGKRNQLSAAYQGGGILYENHSELDSTFHLAAFSDSLSFRRTTLTLSDRYSFLPGFYAGLGGLSYGGAFSLGSLGNIPALNSSFMPSRGILTSAAGHSNTALAQLEYRPAPRSTVTVGGAFETLSSTQAGFVSGNSAMFQAGYDRSLTARDTLAVFYSATLFRYSGIAESIDAHFVAFSYGRRVTGRLALQVYGGPEFFTVTTPGQSGTQTFASGGANLTYHWPKTGAGLAFSRGLTGGSGVLTGAETDSVSATLSRQLSRTWSGGLTGNYYFNSSAPRPNSGSARRTYDDWVGTVHLTRALGRLARLSLFYSFQAQNSNQAFSSGSSIGQSVSRHLLGVTLNFDYRPIGI
jgi:hypothetical protein